jgi:hypothetical protein
MCIEASQVCNLITSKESKEVKGVIGVKDNSTEGYQNPSIVMSLTPLTPTNSFDSSIHAKVVYVYRKEDVVTPLHILHIL